MKKVPVSNKNYLLLWKPKWLRWVTEMGIWELFFHMPCWKQEAETNDCDGAELISGIRRSVKDRIWTKPIKRNMRGKQTHSFSRWCSNSCSVKRRISLGNRPVPTAQSETCEDPYLLCKHDHPVRIFQNYILQWTCRFRCLVSRCSHPARDPNQEPGRKMCNQISKRVLYTFDVWYLK